MRLIVGLGNPGKKYEETRHNVGFLVIDKIAGDGNWSFSKNARAQYIRLDNKVEFLKPQTFMNLSGQAVQYAMQKHKIKPQDILIICDDLDLSLGMIRVRLAGSSGGHKGLDSIINQIGDKFARIRIGIGSNRDQGISSEDYVLQKFTPDEEKIIKKSIDEVEKIVLKFIKRGVLEEETINVGGESH